jgi:predicted Zn-dependent peptidase
MTIRIKTILLCAGITSFLAAGIMPARAEIQELFDQFLNTKVQQFTLDNGMTFLLLNRPEVPVFSGIIQVKAGSVDEPKGKTGIAHVFEHMAFKGTTSIGTKDYKIEEPLLRKIEELGGELTLLQQLSHPDQNKIQALQTEFEAAQAEEQKFIIDNEFDTVYTRNGARFVNAGTSQDTTTYLVSLPKNRLELWARMEADRLMNPVFRQFYKERSVIMEERRMGTDNSPFGQLLEEFNAISFEAHPYGEPVIGWMDEIRNLTIADARKFHSEYYVPSNIVASIVGDVTLDELKEVAQKYFAQIPKKSPPVEFMPVEPPQVSERTVILDRQAEPKLLMGWHSPVFPDPDASALRVAASVLGQGPTSRMYKRLVLTEGLATNVDVDIDDLARYPLMFTVSVDIEPGHTSSEILPAVMEEIRNLTINPPSDAEMQKVKKSLIASFIRRLDANMFLAIQLAFFQNVLGDWHAMGDYLKGIEQIKSEDVARVAENYLKETNRSIGELTGGK